MPARGVPCAWPEANPGPARLPVLPGSRGVALVGRPSLRLGRGGGRKCRTVEPWSGLLAARAVAACALAARTLAARALAARALAARALAARALAARALAALQQPCAAV